MRGLGWVDGTCPHPASSSTVAPPAIFQPLPPSARRPAGEAAAAVAKALAPGGTMVTYGAMSMQAS